MSTIRCNQLYTHLLIVIIFPLPEVLCYVFDDRKYIINLMGNGTTISVLVDKKYTAVLVFVTAVEEATES